MRIGLAGLMLALLSGCSSLPRDSGYEVRTVEVSGRQEPWQNIAINRDVFSREGVAVAYIALPIPIPEKWKQEFVDPTRSYEVRKGDRSTRKALEREVFRAALYHGNVHYRTYDAVLDGKKRGFTVFIPLYEMDEVVGKNLLILSSDGKWGMTTLGKIMEFEKDSGPNQLSTGFFSDHPSFVTQVIRVDSENEHTRIFLASVGRAFPQPFWLRGKNTSYLGKPEIKTVLAEFTSIQEVTDKLISCTNFKVGPGSEAVLPLVAAVYGIQAGIALTKEDCLK